MNAIEIEDAEPNVRAVYEDIMRTRQVQDVNNFWKYLANEPRTLGFVWSALKELMGPGRLDPLTKELVYLAVSITNGCEYCRASHSTAARAKGASDDMLAELYGIVGLANMTNRLATAFAVPVDEAFKPKPAKRESRSSRSAGSRRSRGR